jgi:hypothetical protein
MQWLLHGPLSPDALVRHGHKTHLPAEVGLSTDAAAEELLKAAHAKQWDILTTDAGLAMTPFETRQPFGRCIVYLQLTEAEAGSSALSDAVDRLFARYKRLAPGRLYTVTASRVKIRQLPTARPGL